MVWLTYTDITFGFNLSKRPLVPSVGRHKGQEMEHLIVLGLPPGRLSLLLLSWSSTIVPATPPALTLFVFSPEPRMISVAFFLWTIVYQCRIFKALHGASYCRFHQLVLTYNHFAFSRFIHEHLFESVIFSTCSPAQS